MCIRDRQKTVIDREVFEMEIILASNSSRRKNLLTMLNVPFTVIESGVDERVEEANYMQKGVEHTPYELSLIHI